ncbi:hypothetical protein [Gymnodinialimonas sp. 57CJ19]|uniref:hypothetical protein n=1 Tax=Gymnodinialimonas sp. 57CJ19 TaxID=3138498 RepID=UPI0031345FFB
MTKIQTRLGQLIAASALASAAFTLPATAGFVGVSQCNAAGGSSEPVLHFVDGGRRLTVAVGQGGLTRDIIFNERAALAWAAASGLFPEDSVFGNYGGFVCGIRSEDSDPEPEQPAPPQEPPEQPEQPPIADA